MKISGGVPPLGISYRGPVLPPCPGSLQKLEITRGPAGIGAPHPSLVTAWVTGSMRVENRNSLHGALAHLTTQLLRRLTPDPAPDPGLAPSGLFSTGL